MRASKMWCEKKEIKLQKWEIKHVLWKDWNMKTRIDKRKTKWKRKQYSNTAVE